MNQYLFELHLYDECDSTNTQAWNFFDKNALDGAHLFIAKKQTAGRGRQGRQWNSELRGNLYCSMLFKPNPEMVPFLSLAFTEK